MKEYQKGILTFLIFAILIFLVGEVSFRILGSVNNIDYRIYDKELTNSNRLPAEIFMNDSLPGYTPKPNAQGLATSSDFSLVYRINSQGLRDKEYPRENINNRTRMLAYGDSLTFGEGVPRGDRFTDIAEERLKGVDIINYGSAGRSLGEIVARYKYGDPHEAEYVILFLNDAQLKRDNSWLIQNSSVKSFENTTSGNPAYIERNDSSLAEDNSVLAKSYLASYISYRWRVWKIQDKMERNDRNYWESIDPRITDYADSGERRKRIEYQTNLLLREFISVSERRDQHPIIINIGVTNLSFINSTDGATYYDLSDELNNLNKEKNIRFTYDHHYNPDTHNFIGIRLTDLIKQTLKRS